MYVIKCNGKLLRVSGGFRDDLEGRWREFRGENQEVNYRAFKEAVENVSVPYEGPQPPPSAFIDLDKKEEVGDKYPFTAVITPRVA